MKRRIALLAAALLIFTTACSNRPQPATSTDRPNASSEPSAGGSAKTRVEGTDILAAQAQIDASLIAEAEAGYTFEEPLVIVDPYRISPLSAIALFDTDKPASISLEVEGKNGAAPLIKDFETVSTQHRIPICGLYAEEPAAVTLTARYEDGTAATSVLSVTGGSLPNGFEPIGVLQADASKMAGGWTVMEAGSLYAYTYAIDEAGAVRWLLSSMGVGAVGAVVPLRNGNILTGGDKSFGAYYKYSLFEMDLTGRVAREYLIDGFHHDMAEMPNGNLLVLGNNVNGKVVEDTLYELSRETGEVLRVWDMNSYFDVDGCGGKNAHTSDLNYRNENSNWVSDWLHLNALDYDGASNTVILSSRHQDAIIKMDLTTGEIVWILTDPDDSFPEYLEGKLLTPVGESFEWQYGQHNVTFLPNGDVMCFDNGDYRSKSSEGIVPADTQGYSRAVVYRVNENDMTVSQVWQFGKELGTEFLAIYVSSAQYLGENHYLIDFGGIVKDSDGKATYNNMAGLTGSSRSEVYEVKNDEIVFRASIKRDGLQGNTFRALRMDPCAGMRELDLTEGHSRLGELYRFDLAEEISFDPVAAVSGGPEVSVTDNGVQLAVRANLEAEAENLALVFDGESGVYRIALPAGDTVSYTLNSSEIPTGAYELYLELDSKVYDLGLEWENLSTYRAFPAGCQVEVTAESGGAYGSGIYFAGTAFPVWAESGGTVTITPDEGYTLGSITITDMEGNELGVQVTNNGGTYSFVMPEREVSVTISC